MTAPVGRPPRGGSPRGFERVRIACMANNEDDFDIPEAENEPAAHPRLLDADTCLVDAAIAAAVPVATMERLRGDKIIVVTVRVPTAAWVAPVEKRLKRTLGDGWAFFARDGSNRSRDQATSGNGDVVTYLAKGRSIMGIAPTLAILPSSLVLASDISIEVPATSGEIVADAIGRFLGTEPDATQVANVAGLEFQDIVAFFRRSSTAAEIIAKLEKATTVRSFSTVERLPDLEHAVEYGAARDWAMALVNDFAEYSAGRLEWRSLDHSAIIFGAPGLGKTYLGSLLAQKLNAALIVTSIADLFTGSGYLDSVVKILQETYQRAELIKPVVIVWDEVEALPSRVGLDSRSASYWTTVITKFMLLVSEYRPGVVQLACTNFIEKVDPALRRPGRFGRSIELMRPDAAGVASILRNQLRGDLAGEDLTGVSNMALNRTAAELMQVVQTARRTARVAKRALQLSDLETAIVPRENLPPENLRRISLHEAGHVVAALALDSDEVVHAAIGGMVGAHGHTLFQRSERLETAVSVEDRATVMLAGRASEIALLGVPVVGSSDDLREATILIGAMIMSEGLVGPLTYLADRENIPAVLRLDPMLRKEVELRLQRLAGRAIDVVTRHRDAVDAIAKVLADRRHIGGPEARRIFAGMSPPEPPVQHDLENHHPATIAEKETPCS